MVLVFYQATEQDPCPMQDAVSSFKDARPILFRLILSMFFSFLLPFGLWVLTRDCAPTFLGA
jgi:hypothetical protein